MKKIVKSKEEIPPARRDAKEPERKDGKVIYEIPKPENYYDEDGKLLLHREHYQYVNGSSVLIPLLPIGDVPDEKRINETTIKLYLLRLKRKGHLSDNDPELIKSEEVFYNEQLKSFKRKFKAETTLLEPDYINTWKGALNDFLNESELSKEDIYNIQRLLKFYEGYEIHIETQKETRKKPVQKTFIQFIALEGWTNIQKELFAELFVRQFPFSPTRIGHVIEYLKKGIIRVQDRELKQLTLSLGSLYDINEEKKLKSFYEGVRATIGLYKGRGSTENMYKDEINDIKTKIEAILKEINPS